MERNERARTVIDDSGTGAYLASHDFAWRSDLTTTLCIALEEVAAAEDVELSEPLYETVDPDALARLFEPGDRTPRNAGNVTFAVGPIDVTVRATGEIVLAVPDDAA